MSYVITNQDIDDIVCTALEGGINYWCSKVELTRKPTEEGAKYLSDMVSRGGAIKLEVFEEDRDSTKEPKLLERDNMVQGIKKAAEHMKKSVQGFIEDHDAEMADVAVQFAVFNEIIFG
ncbi:MAG: hypothetical protein M1378_01220 [Bacteroidetes bacterium]|nr:hypothetical protein [Bacteroidota bacterium]